MAIEPILITTNDRASNDARQIVSLLSQIAQRLNTLKGDKPAVEAREAQPRVNPATGQVIGTLPAQPAQEAVTATAITERLGTANAAAVEAILATLQPPQE